MTAQQLPTKWNDLVGTDLFSTSVYVDDGRGRIDAFIDDYNAPRLEDLQNTAQRFVALLLASARQALLDAERCVSARAWRVGVYGLKRVGERFALGVDIIANCHNDDSSLSRCSED